MCLCNQSESSRRRWFETCSCKPVPRGLPSSVKQSTKVGRFYYAAKFATNAKNSSGASSIIMCPTPTCIVMLAARRSTGSGTAVRRANAHRQAGARECRNRARHRPLQDITWTVPEKKAARKAFDKAFERQCASITAEVKKMIASASVSFDIWRVRRKSNSEMENRRTDS